MNTGATTVWNYVKTGLLMAALTAVLGNVVAIVVASVTADQQRPDGSNERGESSGRRSVHQCGR